MWTWQLVSLVLMVGSLVVAEVSEQEAEKVTAEFVQELKTKVQESVQIIDEVFGNAETTRMTTAKRLLRKRSWGAFFSSLGGALLGDMLTYRPVSHNNPYHRRKRSWGSFWGTVAGAIASDILGVNNGKREILDYNMYVFQRQETAEKKQFKADLIRVSEAIDFLKGVVDLAIAEA